MIHLTGHSHSICKFIKHESLGKSTAIIHILFFTYFIDIREKGILVASASCKQAPGLYHKVHITGSITQKQMVWCTVSFLMGG